MLGLLLVSLLVAAPLDTQRGAINAIDVSTRSIETGRALSLTVHGTNPCGAVEIDSGDGHVVTHPITQLPATISHTYRRPGRYEIRARGMGNCDGQTSTGVTVTGEPLPEPGVPTAREPAERGRRRGEERSPDRGTTLTLNPTARWTETGVRVEPGDTIRLEAWGSTAVAPRIVPVGPEGARSARARNAPFPDRPVGALIARIGEDGQPIYVGAAEHTFRADRSGVLFLGINDDDPRDNSGSLTVRIDEERAAVGTSGAWDRRARPRGPARELVAERDVRMRASDEWTDTGIEVRAGDLLRLQASGVVRLTRSARDTADPEGSRTRVAPNAAFPNRPAGALIARIGSGRPIFIGAHDETIRAETDGTLWLGINDDHFPDNSGEFEVRIAVRGR